MNSINRNFDVDALPVHLFVKSQKQAKKLKKSTERISESPLTFKKTKSFKPVYVH